jgi:type II secretory pathway pseudopilin PulG
MAFLNDKRKGQSLIEILVAIGVGVVMLVGAITALTPAIKSQTDANKSQVGAALGAELLDNARVFAEANWHNIDTLTASSSVKYYLKATTSPFTFATGTQTITASSSTFYRDFFLSDVYRNPANDLIALSGTLDPSTRLLTVEYWWGSVTPKTISTYVTRYRNSALLQTDWSGGANTNGPASTTLANKFATSSGIDFTTTTGAIRIQGL